MKIEPDYYISNILFFSHPDIGAMWWNSGYTWIGIYAMIPKPQSSRDPYSLMQLLHITGGYTKAPRSQILAQSHKKWQSWGLTPSPTHLTHPPLPFEVEQQAFLLHQPALGEGWPFALFFSLFFFFQILQAKILVQLWVWKSPAPWRAYRPQLPRSGRMNFPSTGLGHTWSVAGAATRASEQPLTNLMMDLKS